VKAQSPARPACGPQRDRASGAFDRLPVAGPLGLRTPVEGTGARTLPAAAEGDEPVPARYTGRDDRGHAHPVRHRAGQPASAGNPGVVLEYSVNREQPPGDPGSSLLPGQSVQMRQPPPAECCPRPLCDQGFSVLAGQSVQTRP
jgi:hypothetical protein